MTSTSPGSPNDNQNEKVPVGVEAVGTVARRRILNTDPRSISDDVTRTPIQVEKAKNDESTPRGAAPPILDPRSPSTAMPRTPLSLNAGKVSFDEAIETAEAENKPPTRGTVAAELREIERQIEDVVKVQDDESYEKEEGEITHDSDDENEDNENRCYAIGVTPITKRTKSLLESDCRSPLLIENENNAETSFDKALAFELGNMAAKGRVVNRKILGDKSNTTQKSSSPSNDSLVI